MEQSLILLLPYSSVGSMQVGEIYLKQALLWVTESKDKTSFPCIFLIKFGFQHGKLEKIVLSHVDYFQEKKNHYLLLMRRTYLGDSQEMANLKLQLCLFLVSKVNLHGSDMILRHVQ